MSTVGKLLEQHKSIVFPGVYDALSAKVAHKCGFELAFVSGYASSATLLGLPDMGYMNLSDLESVVRHCAMSTPMPLIADADNGYGNEQNVRHSITSLIRAGAKGCFLEDQQLPKRCGHMQGKRIVGRQEYIDKIHAAAECMAGQDFFLVARTDSLATDGMDEALERMHAAKQAGANGFFIEAPEDTEQMRHICANAPKPLVANLIQGGKTPVLPLAEMTDLGYQLILYPLVGLYSATKALEGAYQDLRKAGQPGGREIISFEDFNDLVSSEYEAGK